MKALQLPFSLRAPRHAWGILQCLERNLSELCHRVSLCTVLLENLSSSLQQHFSLHGARGELFKSPESASSLHSMGPSRADQPSGFVSGLFNNLFDQVCMFMAFQLPALVFWTRYCAEKCCSCQRGGRKCDSADYGQRILTMATFLCLSEKGWGGTKIL